MSKDLHSQRGTDVVEVERAYGDKLERIQETTKCEARALKHEARAQRDALKEMRIQFTKACGERLVERESANHTPSSVLYYTYNRCRHSSSASGVRCSAIGSRGCRNGSRTLKQTLPGGVRWQPCNEGHTQTHPQNCGARAKADRSMYTETFKAKHTSLPR